jgi:hypothetical protein
MPNNGNFISSSNWESQIWGSRWCWAACTVAIARSLGVTEIQSAGSAALPLTQCGVYVKTYGMPQQQVCTVAGSNLDGTCRRFVCADSGAMGVRGVVSEALGKVLPTTAPQPLGRLGQPTNPNAPGHDPSYTHRHIYDMIDRGHPVAVLIAPAGSPPDTRHYVLIHGYDILAGRLEVWDPDPSYGQRSVSFSEFREKIGEWRGTVLLG